MKHTIAAGILMQVLPATISEESPSKLLEQEVSNDIAFPLPRAVKSIFHAGKAHGRDNTNDAFQGPELGGIVKNVPVSKNMKACDPSSSDPDIGILSCDQGLECVVDQDSTLGGLCTSISRRDLQQADAYVCFLCEYGSGPGPANWGLPLDAPGYEGLTCGSLYAAYRDFAWGTNELANFTLDASNCGSASQVARGAGCCISYNCNLCGDSEFLPDVTIEEVAPFSFKCSRVPGVINDTFCATYGPYFARFCCGSETGGLASVVPTPVPVVATTSTPSVPDSPSVPDAPPAAPSSSDSASMWSPSAIVSMMSLTMGTAGALL